MCGISGIYGIEDKILTKRMISKLSKRGPENTGFAMFENGSVANARLSIIDVVGGNQPIWNEDETIAIVANCEIYNYQEIRNKLIKLGHEFRTKSDVEVIVHGYEEWGIEVAKIIDGIFAIAIYDSKTNRLILIRDRLGIKPLYYYHRNNILLFGSEVKAILEYEEIYRKLDIRSLELMIQLGYVMGKRSMFENIEQLPPSHVLQVSADGVTVQKYWSLPKLIKNAVLNMSKLDELVSKAVKSQLISERPLGIFLSGGLDSSIVASYASSFSDDITAFTQSFGEVDETPFAIEIAEHLGIEHFIVDHTPEMEIKLSEELIYAIEHPTFGLSHTYTLSKFAKSKGKVVMLSGLGGDELFGGYVQHKRALKYGKSPNFGKLSSWPANMFEKIKAQKLARIARMAGNTSQKLIGLKLSLAKDETSNILESKREQINWESEFQFEEDNSFFRVVETELIYDQLEANYLKIADRMSMAASLEMRVPLLDTNLVNYALSLPVDQKISDNISKYALRELVKSKLPPKIISRGFDAKNKGGYVFDPVDFWSRGMKDHVSTRLSPDKIRDYGIFKNDWVQKELKTASSFAKIRILWTLASTHDLIDKFQIFD